MSDRPWKLFPGWICPIEAEEWKKKLNEKINWEQPLVKVFGKDHLIPRKTIFLGDMDIHYSYSGITHISEGWPTWFLPLLEKVSLKSGATFNGCLLNLYRNGNDRMGWHSDNERELIPDKPIASLSFGSSRDFCLKHRLLVDKETIVLKDGDLLIMYPPSQEQWKHSVPIRKKVSDFRINLTFRCYK